MDSVLATYHARVSEARTAMEREWNHYCDARAKAEEAQARMTDAYIVFTSRAITYDHACTALTRAEAGTAFVTFASDI